jgi:SH3 domain-containing YSC84-like protein 1
MRRVAILGMFVALFSWAAWAQGAKSQELNDAANVLQSMASSNQVPQQLLDQAKCVAVVPGLTKAGFIVGGEHGNGVVSCRTSSGWSAPAFISITGGSFGLQAGAENSDIILLMNQEGEQKVMNGNFQLGGQVVAAGPNGSSYNASAGWKAPVLAYTRSNGAYAGANIAGSKISVDNTAMHNVYGHSESVNNVLSGSAQTPQQAQPFTNALEQTGKK